MSDTRPGTKAILVKWRPEVLDHLDESLESLGYSERAQFIRDAVVEKLTKMGLPPKANAALSPLRLGKGGRTTPQVRSQLEKLGGDVPSDAALNDAQSDLPNQSKPGTISYRRGKKGKPNANQD